MESVTVQPLLHNGLEPPASRVARRPARRAAIDLDVTVLDRRLRRRFLAPDAPARLSDIVPLARQLADELSEIALRHARSSGKVVPCKRGCAACCRYLVPLSPPEAFRLFEEIHFLPPARRRRVLESFAAATGQLLKARHAVVPTGAGDTPEAYEQPGLYVPEQHCRLKVPCPLLVSRECMLYPTRPIACRSYFAVSDPLHGRDPRPGRHERLPMPFSLVGALSRLAAEVESTEPQAVLLPLAPIWSAERLTRMLRTWPGPELVERLVLIVTELAGAARPAGRAGAAQGGPTA
jgi:hypothetical protein